MKVRELMNKAHLINGQHTKLNDVTNQETYVTVDRYAFELGSDAVEKLLNMKVNSFSVSNDGLTIWAEESNRSR